MLNCKQIRKPYISELTNSPRFNMAKKEGVFSN